MLKIDSFNENKIIRKILRISVIPPYGQFHTSTAASRM